MTITRAQAEATLVSRCRKIMELVGFAVTVVGTNADLNEPLSTALRKLSIVPSDPVADADLSRVDEDDDLAFLDLAELRLLQNIHGNYTAVNMQLGPRREDFDQVRKGLETRINSLKASIKEEYGIGGSSLSTGTITLNFAEHDDGTNW